MSLCFSRKRLWVDSPVQSRLLIRTAAYFLIYTVTLMHLGFALEVLHKVVLQGEETAVAELYVEFLSRQSSLLIAMLLIVPCLLYDLVKFSHRIVGPLYRCRQVMEDMAGGKPVPEFVVRKPDLMADLFQAFNKLINAWNTRVGVGPGSEPTAARKPEVVPAEINPRA